MAGINWGGADHIKDKPVIISVISSLSPLQYSGEMAGALIEYARHGQAVLIGLLMMVGSTGPVTLAGLMALQNNDFRNLNQSASV
ncbi:trimethylamine methyltransferase family protein [Desulfococcaceae bacterium HSG9]|nr:trimethylamine methyltransferase family protein [Desulfococcaceae bacterium HSG9]